MSTVKADRSVPYLSDCIYRKSTESYSSLCKNYTLARKHRKAGDHNRKYQLVSCMKDLPCGSYSQYLGKIWVICVKTFLHQQLSFPRHYDEIIYSKVAPLRRNSLVLEKLYFESLGLLLVIPCGPIHILNLFPFRIQVMDQKKTQTSFSFLLF